MKTKASVALFSFKQECVVMNRGSDSFGKWVATDCNSTYGFICSRDVGEFSQTLWTCFVERLIDFMQTFAIHNILLALSLFFTCLDPGIAPVATELPKTFVKLGNSSFKVIQENLTWSEANSRCMAEGAHLASIRDLVTQAYLELQVFRAEQPMWIGLNSVKVLRRSEKGKIIALQFVGIFTQNLKVTFMGFFIV